jgi:hypothetical protein
MQIGAKWALGNIGVLGRLPFGYAIIVIIALSLLAWAVLLILLLRWLDGVTRTASHAAKRVESHRTEYITGQ